METPQDPDRISCETRLEIEANSNPNCDEQAGHDVANDHVGGRQQQAQLNKKRKLADLQEEEALRCNYHATEELGTNHAIIKDCQVNEDDQEELCTTPRGSKDEEGTVHACIKCPPAPRKPKPKPRKRLPSNVGFFIPPDLELFLSSPQQPLNSTDKIMIKK